MKKRKIKSNKALLSFLVLYNSIYMLNDLHIVFSNSCLNIFINEKLCHWKFGTQIIFCAHNNIIMPFHLFCCLCILLF